MSTMSRSLSLIPALLLGVASTAWAGPSCHAPREQWQNEAAFKAKLEAQGYQIKTFKISKGQCYEIYGHDKAGQKVEIYFDPATGTVVKQG